jgi:hypothetical protein
MSAEHQLHVWEMNGKDGNKKEGDGRKRMIMVRSGTFACKKKKNGCKCIILLRGFIFYGNNKR